MVSSPMHIKFSHARMCTQFTSGSRSALSTSTRRMKTLGKKALEGQESRRGYLEELGPGPGQSIFHLGSVSPGLQSPHIRLSRFQSYLGNTMRTAFRSSVGLPTEVLA